MDFAGYLDSLAADGATLSAAARSVPLDTPVPPCPGWSGWGGRQAPRGGRREGGEGVPRQNRTPPR
ncbi:MAG: hypothetical protein ACR2J0_04385, partial [Mycobacteriales bacterium]